MPTFLTELLEKHFLNEDDDLVSKDFLIQNKSKFAELAQNVYDEWDEENIDEYAGGGICHLIADEICNYLAGEGVDCTSVNTCVGENHVFVVAKTDDGVFEIDIPPSTYETGGGYNWQKIHGVQFNTRDIEITMLDLDPDTFDDYIDD